MGSVAVAVKVVADGVELSVGFDVDVAVIVGIVVGGGLGGGGCAEG